MRAATASAPTPRCARALSRAFPPFCSRFFSALPALFPAPAAQIAQFWREMAAQRQTRGSPLLSSPWPGHVIEARRKRPLFAVGGGAGLGERGE
eukprot:2870399-Pleurochrysis_carterae.AAC.1